jgi:hypothetical protein
MSLIGSIRDAVTGLTASVEARKQTPTGNALNVQIGPGDVISNIPVFMDFPHHQMHEGEAHQWSWYGAVNSTTKNLRLSVPASTATTRTPHLLPEILADAAALIYLYEGTTWTSGGTAQTNVYNRNRNSLTAPGLAIYAAGGTALTVNAAGTLLTTFWVMGTNKVGTDTGRDTMEWCLKTSTEYNLQIVTTSNANVLIRLNWYEDLGV